MYGYGKSHSRLRQITSLVVSVALLCAVIALSVHSREIEHAVCSEHGELIHVGVAGAGLGHVAAVLDDSERESGEREHEHCGMNAASRETALSRAAVDNSASVAPVFVVRFSRTAVFADIATYRIAPKTSPPTA